MDDPATIDEFAAEGYNHVSCHCLRAAGPECGRLAGSMGLTLAQLSARLRCTECGGLLYSVKPGRHADELGKPQVAAKLIIERSKDNRRDKACTLTP
jgi:hypothetical protein